MTVPAELFPVFPTCSHGMGTEKPNVYKGVPSVPGVPTEKQQVSNCWYVNGRRVTKFPRCPACHGFALYRKDNQGAFECLTCELAGIEESVARDYEDERTVVQ